MLALFVRFSGDNRRARRNHFDNEETEILVIPDLEDEGEEDIVTKGGYEAHKLFLPFVVVVMRLR